MFLRARRVNGVPIFSWKVKSQGHRTSKTLKNCCTSSGGRFRRRLQTGLTLTGSATGRTATYHLGTRRRHLFLLQTGRSEFWFAGGVIILYVDLIYLPRKKLWTTLDDWLLCGSSIQESMYSTCHNVIIREENDVSREYTARRRVKETAATRF